MSILNYLKETLIDEEKWAKDVNPKKGKMHKLLNIPDDKKVSDVYTSGEKLAKALVKATGSEKEASSMLAFAANVDKTDNVLDKALRYMKKINTNEAITEEEDEKSFDGDPKALVDAMIDNAPGSKEQIGTILKYAANSIPIYNIWDAALDYFESIENQDDGTGDDEVDIPKEEPTDEVDISDDEPTDEVDMSDDEPTDEEKPDDELKM